MHIKELGTLRLACVLLSHSFFVFSCGGVGSCQVPCQVLATILLMPGAVVIMILWVLHGSYSIRNPSTRLLDAKCTTYKALSAYFLIFDFCVAFWAGTY